MTVLKIEDRREQRDVHAGAYITEVMHANKRMLRQRRERGRGSRSGRGRRRRQGCLTGKQGRLSRRTR